MIFHRTARALAVAALLSFGVGAPVVALAGGKNDIVMQAMQAANLSADQQNHIQQMISDERARARSEADRSARKADKKQLRANILALMNPDQRAAFSQRLRELKAERKAAKVGAPPPQQ
jgi:hypothetical protein